MKQNRNLKQKRQNQRIQNLILSLKTLKRKVKETKVNNEGKEKDNNEDDFKQG